MDGEKRGHKKGFGGQPNPEQRANILSRLSFWWANEYVFYLF